MSPIIDLGVFADQYRLRIRRDACGDQVAPGKYGHVYPHDSSSFGLVLEAPADNTRADRTLKSRRHKALLAGFRKHQWGHVEAILLFDPSNEQQARLAIALAGVRRRKVPSPNQLAALRNAVARRRLQRLETMIPCSDGQDVPRTCPSTVNDAVSVVLLRCSAREPQLGMKPKP